MTRMVEFNLQDGGVLLVEVQEGESKSTVVRSATPVDVATKAQHTFEQALSKVKPAAEGIISNLRDLSYAPEEVKVEFGIKLNAEAGAILASVGTEANFKITLNWKR